MDVEEVRALYRRWLPGLWNAAPEEMSGIAAEVFSSDAVAHWGDGSDYVGPDAIAGQVRESVTLFQDVVVSLLTGPIVDGAWVVGRWEFAGTYRGDIPGAQAPAGTAARYTGMDLVRVDGGRLVEYWPYGRDITLLRQLEALG